MKSFCINFLCLKFVLPRFLFFGGREGGGGVGLEQQARPLQILNKIESFAKRSMAHITYSTYSPPPKLYQRQNNIMSRRKNYDYLVKKAAAAVARRSQFLHIQSAMCPKMKFL